jgi:glutamine kinase
MAPPGFSFGTKSETLERLAPLLRRSVVPEFTSFTVGDWIDDPGGVVAAMGAKFADLPVIVRSSAVGEDGGLSAMAGAFASVADVDVSDPAALCSAVETVIASYQRQAAPAERGDQVIVQHMIVDVLVSGVLFTQDMNTGAPYYVINYDDESGKTDTVTAGYTNRTLYVYRDAWDRLESRRFRTIIEAVKEVEALTGDSDLDIEFALDRDHIVHLFQVRRITTQPNWNRGLSLRVFDALSRLEESLADRFGDTDGGMGDAVLGNMPDWNPAEMIGTTPRPLAFSLYRMLITDRVWRAARRRMGYREHRGVPLMLSLAGQPYIDVRESFASYLPAPLPPEIGDRLVSAWLRRLRDNRELHDKIEFDVAVTTFAPDFDQRVGAQFPDVLDPGETQLFRDCLRHLTNDLISGRRAPVGAQVAKVDTLARLRASAFRGRAQSGFETVVQLLEDAAEAGTLPFSILARHGFIAGAILKGLVAREAMTPEEAEQFQRSVPTVASEFIRDVDAYTAGLVGEADLLDTYGHLRPGTYDILSVRYAERFAGMASFDREVADLEPEPPFVLSDAQRRKMASLIASEGYDTDVDGLLHYMRSAIQGREYAKFQFSRNISEALEVIAGLGERHGLSREELSYIDVRKFLDCFIEPSGRTIESELRHLSEMGQDRHRVTSAIRLPSLVTRLSDLWIVPLAVEQPNYVTRKSARGEVAFVTGDLIDPSLIDGKVVAIQSADPGFDWIFTRPILGLVTRFGGANSHMAIRCAEFGLPAAIGCGEQIFDRVIRRGRVDLNCAQGQIVAT